MYHFCTYFDRNFLTKGLTLYRSLAVQVAGRFTLWILCLEELTYATLLKLAPEGSQGPRCRILKQGNQGRSSCLVSLGSNPEALTLPYPRGRWRSLAKFVAATPRYAFCGYSRP